MGHWAIVPDWAKVEGNKTCPGSPVMNRGAKNEGSKTIEFAYRFHHNLVAMSKRKVDYEVVSLVSG